MGGDDLERRQLALRRRLAPGGAAARDRARAALAEALGDPERLAHYVRLFGQLAVVLEPLAPLRSAPSEVVAALRGAAPELAALPAGEARTLALRRAMRARLADPARLELFAAAITAAQREVAAANAARGEPEQDVLLALTAGGVMLSSCKQAPGSDHPFWDVLFEVSLSEAVLSGHLLGEVVAADAAVDVGAAARTFARGLQDEALARELDALGLDDPSPAALAAGYAELVASPLVYALQLDALLHLARAHVALAPGLVRALAREGLSPEVEATIRAAHQEAYTRDVGPELAGELRRWFTARLTRLRDDPAELEAALPHPLEVERRRCLAAVLALATFPPEESALLRVSHARSLERVRRLAPELEAGFVIKLWNDPEDRYTLEQFEQLLAQRREAARARRVREYLRQLRSGLPLGALANAAAPTPEASS